MNPYETPTVTLLGRIESRETTGFTVTTVAGWSLRIDRRDGGTFDAVLTNPFDTSPYESRFRASAEEAVEKACSYLRDFLGQPSAAAALRSMATAELAVR